MIPVIARNDTIKQTYRGEGLDFNSAYASIINQMRRAPKISGRSQLDWWDTARATGHASLRVEPNIDDVQCPTCGQMNVTRVTRGTDPMLQCNGCGRAWEIEAPMLNTFPETIENYKGPQ
jgi:ribosomal protein L37AE/L43A